ncbi:MAG TPA: hypothetical protein VM283_09240, partial [Armatimonadota bacterium]|nr:hypothetical protein [Armatimonadota bacterium]
MFHLTTAGSPRDRGIQHGHAIPRTVIERALRYARWKRDRPAGWAAVEEAMWTYLSDRFPELAAEIEGIGEGAGIGLPAARHL